MSFNVEQKRPKYTYFDFKAGRCKDVDYFRSAYGGVVTKHFDERDTDKTHPFFLVYREVKESEICHYYEVKVYDFTRGLIIKKKVRNKISNELCWNGDDEHLGIKDNNYFREYVQYLIDSFIIILPPKKETKKSKKNKKGSK